MVRKRGQQKGNRRGDVFAVRVTDEERADLEKVMRALPGPKKLGPFLVWNAVNAVKQATAIEPVIPSKEGITALAPGPGIARPGAVLPPPARKVILDLCAGSGAWSKPYSDAGYEVVKVTLPDSDVRAFRPPPNVWGVLAAPPCDQFSLARNGHKSPRNIDAALELVLACLRIIALASPRWWALENPVGLLGGWMGTPRDVFEPFMFGDPWTKRTALWGRFTIPQRGPWVEPQGSAMDRRTAAARAITPPGFARAFFEANP